MKIGTELDALYETRIRDRNTDYLLPHKLLLHGNIWQIVEGDLLPPTDHIFVMWSAMSLSFEPPPSYHALVNAGWQEYEGVYRSFDTAVRRIFKNSEKDDIGIVSVTPRIPAFPSELLWRSWGIEFKHWDGQSLYQVYYWVREESLSK